MREVLEALSRLAPTNVAVTLIGEPGTGKGLLARALHSGGLRSNGPFIVFRCAGKPQAEWERANAVVAGDSTTVIEAIERAQDGTLLLDQVSDLSLGLQDRLLQSLDARDAKSPAGLESVRVDVRLLASTDRDLAPEASAGKLRDGLYQRLSAAIVRVPPLRERLEDLALLVPALLVDLGRSDVTATDATHAVLRSRVWPGNVQELKNVLEHALVRVELGVLEPHHLPASNPTEREDPLDQLPLGGQRLDRIEKAAIKLTLAQFGGNKVHTARALGIAVSTLYEKLKKYELS